jgi:hypothetical protein
MGIVERLDELATALSGTEDGNTIVAARDAIKVLRHDSLYFANLATERGKQMRDLHEVVEEFVAVMNILSARVGITVKDVADLMNPVGDKARAILEKK